MPETPTNEQSAEIDNESVTNKIPTAQPPAAKAILHSPEEDESTCVERHREAERRHWRFERTAGGVALVLTAVAAIGAVASAIAAFNALTASQQAAKAAIDQAVSARESNTEAQRPFVLFTGLDIQQQSPIDPGLPYLWIRVIAQNSGNTPTKDMRYISVGPTRSSPVDPDSVYHNPPSGFDRWRMTMPPHYSGPLLGGLVGIPLSSFQQAVDQHASYFIYGATHYFDRFTNSKEHITKFCYIIGASINDKSLPAYTPCLFWNCADDDCAADEREYEQRMEEARRGSSGPH